ncbi:IS5 family transposase [Streptomyces sp. NPDC048196]|uniref:IS5 family transposase n=1 Tax=Streptomyces sp. NPDC048196 TaxID=3154712 RepID=UPI0033D226FC
MWAWAGDLTDAEWERLQPFLPVSNRRCGRWRDHRQVIEGILHRMRTGVQWRDLPEWFGPWKTVYERHRPWSADGTWERLLQQVQAEADADGEADWDTSVASTIVRAHQHAAGARTEPPPAPTSKGGRSGRTPGRNAVAEPAHPWWRWCRRRRRGRHSGGRPHGHRQARLGRHDAQGGR